MATVDLSYVQFWQPPPKPSLRKQHTFPRKHSRAASATRSQDQPVAASRLRGRDFEAQPEDEEGDAQELAGRTHDPTNYDEDADDSLPSIEEILGSPLRKEIAVTGYQGTRERPVILEDDERDTPDPTADSEINSSLVNCDPVPAFELSQRADPSNREAWWDVEEGCFVYEDLHPLPPLDHESLPSAPAQGQPPSRCHSLGVFQEQIKLHGDDRIARSAPEESTAQSLLATLDEDGGGESEEIVSDLERDMQLALEEGEALLATSPSSPRPHRSAEPSHPQIDQDCDQGWSEELRPSSRLCGQDEEKEGPRQQEQEEMTVDEIRQEVVEQELEEVDDDDDNWDCEQRREKRQQQDEEVNSSIHHSESSSNSYDTDEDDNPRPAKQRRLFPVSPATPPTPPFERSPKPSLGQPHSAPLSSTTQPEIGDTQSQTDIGHPPSSVNNNHHCAPLRSRSPSDTEESAPVAEYHEWPFQGFVKRVTIGNRTTYNLEFSLSNIPEHLNLSLHSEVSSTSPRESSVEAAFCCRAVTSRKPGKELTKSQERMLAKMVQKDKTWAEIGRQFPGHTLQELKENFFKKQGGKPRKRGRKPGVRVVCA